MQFRIADTFTDSLTRLTNDEQKSVKTTAFDLQLNPDSPGMSFHKLDKARDKNFWSVRVNSDIRLIVHKTSGSLLLCYVDHHDKAYAWAERRKLEAHPVTGAAQFVEVRETVQEIIVPVYIESRQEIIATPLFAKLSDDEILRYGVPAEWLTDVRAATDDNLLDLAAHLPAEAGEALLELAIGGKPRVSADELVEINLRESAQVAVPDHFDEDAFNHPDAQRRFRIISNTEELQRALDAPWEKWAVFLHPDQRQFVERDYAGPARVSGSAGTGKTVVALHRAAFLARTNPDARILLATFSDILANALRGKLFALVHNEPRLAERIDVYSLNAIGRRLYQAQHGQTHLAGQDDISQLLNEASQELGAAKFSRRFLLSEWEQIVDAWQLETWEDYRDVARLGRKTRLPEHQRALLWSIFEKVREGLRQRNLITHARMFQQLAQTIGNRKNPLFDFTVIDEAQDIDIAQLRFLAALGASRPNGLFFAGDLGQRIFQQPFSWLAMGVDIRGRSRTLRVNYRTSHQIRSQADQLLGPEISDVDGNTEERRGTISVFNGPTPTIQVLDNREEEITEVAAWLANHAESGLLPHEFGVFVRSEAQIPRARTAVELAGLPFKVLDEEVELAAGTVSLSTMHLAKGLEFRAVVVMACDDEIIPLQERIETVGDDADLQEVYDTERQLLYVACTRARDHLLVTSTAPASEFLDDLRVLD